MFKIITICALLIIICSIALLIYTNCADRDAEDTSMATIYVICLIFWIGIIIIICGIRGILLNGDVLMNISEKISCITMTKENGELTDVCITYNGEEHHFKISDNSDVKHHSEETYK